MRSLIAFSALTAVLILAGCHSAYISATISNHTTVPLSLIEVDYPSASFGTQALAPGQDFHYRFKVLGSGPTVVLWTIKNHDQKDAGPTLREGDEGQLTIIFSQDPKPAWSLKLLNRTPAS